MSAEKRFLFTGFESAPKRRLMRKIKDLGGIVLSPEDLKLNKEFILICAQPKWTEKFITACSAGLWILHPDFVERSSMFGYWLRESQFEWSLRKHDLLGSGFGEGRLLEAPQRWRIQVASGGKRAFHGWNVLIMVKQKLNKETYARMLTYGGAVVVRKRECLSEDVWKSLTHIFVDEDFCLHHAGIVKSLIKEGFQCLNPSYIQDYVAQVSTGKVVKLEPPNLGNYYVGSPELFRAAQGTMLLESLVAGLPPKDSMECAKQRKTREKDGARLQARHGVQDERVLEALRKSVLELVPSSLVSRQQKEQLLSQEAAIVIKRLQENLPCRESKDRPKIKQLEVKSSLVIYSTGKCDKKTQKDDFCVDLQHNVVFEDISCEKMCNPSSNISCPKETLGLKATNPKKRRILDDSSFSCKRKKPIRVSSNLPKKLLPPKTNDGSLLRNPVLNEMTTKTKCVVIAAEPTEGTHLFKKPVELSSAPSPLSHRLPLFPKQVVNETTSSASELQVNLGIQNETSTYAKESSRDHKENLDLFAPSLSPALSVVDSHGSVNLMRLSEYISVQDFSKNHLLFSSTASSFLPLRRNSMKLNELHEVVDQQCDCEEQLTDSDFFSSLSSIKQSSLKNSAELLNSKHFQPMELNHLITLNSDWIDLNPSSIFPSELSNSNCYESTILNQPVLFKNSECVTSNQPVMFSNSECVISNQPVMFSNSECVTSNQPVTFSNSECVTFNPAKRKVFVQDYVKSHQLVNTNSKCIELGKSLVIRNGAYNWMRSNEPLPHSTKKHQLSNAVTMLIDACLNAEDETRFSGRDSLKKFVDAISFFVTPKSYPPSGTLALLLKMLVEEQGLDDRLRQQISTLIKRILLLHEPTSASMKQVYVEALSHVSTQNQNWQLVEYLFRKVIECSDGSCSSNVDLLLLHFIVRFLELDFVESTKRLLSAGYGKGRSVRWCLMTQWLWTNEFAAVRSSQFGQLVAVLLMALHLKNHSAQMVVLGLAQKLIAMGAEAWLLSSGGVSMETSCIPSDTWMLALVIAEKLADERTRSDELKLFLDSSECDWLAMVICKMLVDRMNRNGVVENSALCLRLIVTYFHLQPYEEANEDVNPKAKSEILTPSKASLGSPNRPLVKRRRKLKDVNKTNTKGETELHAACRKNNLTLVRELLQTPGVDVNWADNAGWTPLHEACNHGNVEVVQELLQFKPKRTISSYFTTAGPSQMTFASVDVRAASLEGGITPLHDAVLNSHSDVCRLLLQHAGPQLLEIVDKKGKTPTDYAKTDEMKCLLSKDDSICEELSERKPGASKTLSNTSLSSTQSAAAQDNTSTAETAQPSQAERSAMLCQAISSDCSQRYCILVSSLVTFYVSWRRDRLTADDREVLAELPVHVLRLRRNLLELQNGKLLTGQIATLAQLEALSDLQMIAVDHRPEYL